MHLTYSFPNDPHEFQVSRVSVPCIGSGSLKYRKAKVFVRVSVGTVLRDDPSGITNVTRIKNVKATDV